MDSTSPVETAAKPSSGYRAVAYDPDDDPYSMSETEGKKPGVGTGEEINQSVPQMEIEAKPADRSEEEQVVVSTQEKQEPKAETVVTPEKDPLQASVPVQEGPTPPTTLPDPASPQQVSPVSPEVKQKHKRGAEPIASSSCRCCLM